MESVGSVYVATVSMSGVAGTSYPKNLIIEYNNIYVIN